MKCDWCGEDSVSVALLPFGDSIDWRCRACGGFCISAEFPMSWRFPACGYMQDEVILN